MKNLILPAIKRAEHPVCYHCARQIIGGYIETRDGFKKSFHARCYENAERAAELELHRGAMVQS